ncbi:MAG: hypothetical protein IPM37_09630 [Hahellaceae bacterium]|nr:hypothetical protein [Hahellaceae bacterium]
MARDIQLAGGGDTFIDAVSDSAARLAGAPLDQTGGIGISFANSNMSMRVGDVGFYLSGVGQTSSIGAAEVIGFNIDGLDIVMRGNGL